MAAFADILADVQKSRQSLLCVGLDPDPSRVPASLSTSPDPILEFNRRIIDATHDLVCAYKPNLAFYEALGRNGVETLRKTISFVPKPVIVIGDGKRGDIGNTAARYAASLFDDYGFGAVTVNPYMGFDSVEPFLSNPERGVFLLALTSNPGSKDFQRQRVGTMPLYQKVVRAAKKWNAKGNIGLVVGATHPAELARVRRIAPSLPILVPGVGAQGGDLRGSVRAGCTRDGWLAVINASRSILYASSGPDFADAARAEALKMVEAMRAAQESIGKNSVRR